MEEKDVVKQIEDASNKVQMRDFEEVWSDLESRIQQENPETPKKKTNRWIYMVASFAACIIIFCSVGIPLLFKGKPEELVYYYDNLTSTTVEKTVFYNGIDNSDVNVVDLTSYDGEYILFTTEDGEVKGGWVKFNCTFGTLSYMVDLKFVSSDVQSEDEIAYDKDYDNNGATGKYLLQSTQGVINTFVASASYNSVNYTMEIMTDATDLTEFFNEFFF